MDGRDQQRLFSDAPQVYQQEHSDQPPPPPPQQLPTQQLPTQQLPPQLPTQQSRGYPQYPVGLDQASESTTVAPLVAPSSPEEVYQFVIDLTVASKRERVLLELSRRRESFADLAPILWHSFGVITAILQEIISIYPQLNPPTLASVASNRVCNALALLQCVASHPETRQPFLNAHIPLFLYPFLNTVSVSRPFEYLRLTSLGVIGALVKVDDHEVIGFLLQTEIVSLCLRIMEIGSELSKTVATFIVQKILLDDLGLRYVCATAERFYALSSVLSGMVQSLVEQPSPRLLKHVIKCYMKLAENPRAREAFRRCLPATLRQAPLLNVIKDDATTKQNIATLLDLVDNNPTGQMFDVNSAAEVVSAAQQKQKLQQQQRQLQQALQQNLQHQHNLLQLQQQQQQQQQQQSFQQKQLLHSSLVQQQQQLQRMSEAPPAPPGSHAPPGTLGNAAHRPSAVNALTEAINAAVAGNPDGAGLGAGGLGGGQ